MSDLDPKDFGFRAKTPKKTKKTERDEELRAKLRSFLKYKEKLLDWVGGGDKRVLPLSPPEQDEFGKLIKRYKYDPEFADALSMYSGRAANYAHKRSRLR